MRNVLVLLLLVAACSHAPRAVERELLIDVSMFEPFSGWYRYTVVYTPGDRHGILRQSGLARGSRRVSLEEIRRLTSFATTELMPAVDDWSTTCDDCVEMVAVVRLGAEVTTKKFRVSEYPVAIERFLELVGIAE